jgi:hypothetical protein
MKEANLEESHDPLLLLNSIENTHLYATIMDAQLYELAQSETLIGD